MASAWVRHMPLNPASVKEATHKFRERDYSWVKSLAPNFGLYYLYYCDLAVITQEIVNKVYSTDCVMVPWANIENRIGELRSRIDLWFRSIPSTMNFTQKTNDGPDRLRCKLALAFHFYSARITLGRPCLCRRDARQKSPAERSSFSHEMAVLTLESATNMLDLIPHQPNAVQLYEIAPWWCILHYIMQAATVLLLELSFGSVHMPEAEERFVALAKKSVLWLYAMSQHNVASRRAWQLCDICLRRLAAGMKFDISNIPLNLYQPTPQPTFDNTNTYVGQINHFEHPGLSQNRGGSAFDILNLNDSNYSQPFPLEGENYNDIALSDFPISDPLTLPSADEHIVDDLYLPYDPMSGEFIRSFFPHENKRQLGLKLKLKGAFIPLRRKTSMFKCA